MQDDADVAIPAGLSRRLVRLDHSRLQDRYIADDGIGKIDYDELLIQAPARWVMAGLLGVA